MRPNKPHSGDNSDADTTGDRRAFSGPIPLTTKPKKHTRFNLSSASTSTVPAAAATDDGDIKFTINIRDDSIAVHSGNNVHVFHTGPNALENPEHSLLANRTLQKKPSFLRASFLRFVSLSRRRSSDLKTPAVTLAIKCLKFIAAKVSSDGPSAKTDGDSASVDSGDDVASARWEEVEKRFEELTGSTDGLLPSSLFGECIGMNKDSKEFDSRLFRALARRCNISNDSINISELKKFWDHISDGEFDSRLLIFFEMVDTNADERITEEEVEEIISISASANKLSNIHVKAKEYAALIMEELDRGNAGYIELQDLRTLLLDAPNQSVRVSDTRVLSKLLSETLKYTDKTNPIIRTYDKFLYFVMDNWQRIWVLLLWLGICGGLFAYKFLQYRNRAVFNVMGYCVSIAKGGAETLKFNMALILLPVCRNTITWLRNKTKLGAVVPFDDNLNFHKVIAAGIAVGVGLHALSHLTCDFPRLLHATEEEYEPMKPFFGEEQPDNYWWFVKGIEGVTGIIMVVLMAIAFTLATPWFRRGKLDVPKPLKRLTGFNAFWYSHHLFVIVYTLLVVHGIYLYLTKEWYKKTTWMYLALPVVLYACGRLTRALRSSVKPVKILKVAVYPGKVLALHLSKPNGFKYKSGQYMFVNCRDVSPFEWHPFSITSAPGDDYLSVHIRSLGDWTRQLSTVFSKVCQPPQAGKSGLLRAEFMQGGAPNPIFPKIIIDGPYGAPAQDYKNYDVVLLVGLGIGATPMVSIVKDIIDNMKEKEAEANAVENGEGRSRRGTSKHGKDFKTQKAYFYWLTREQGSYEWFKGLMNEVAEMDERGVIELHNHCTSVYEEGNARSAFITMLQSLEHAKNGVDVVSGTRVRSHFGKPNWKKVYKKVTLNHPDTRVGVFYCGNPAPVNELKQLALDFSHKTSTKFEFHKENF